MRHHESTKTKEFSIIETDESLTNVINSTLNSGKHNEAVENASIVIAPFLGFRDCNYPVFPVMTEELYAFIKEKCSDVEICIEDDEYKELALHADLITIATFFVTSVALPVLVNLLAEYIKDKIVRPGQDRAIRISIVKHNKGKKSKKFTYEGKPEFFDETIKSAKEMWDD